MTKTRNLILGLSLCPLLAWAGENAAPSSHLVFDDDFEGDIIINEVRVPAAGEALHTYYEALGWRGKGGGYAGIQAHPKAHNYIFSIWDHKSHTAPIKAVHVGPGTSTEKFGGEGTGLKSWNFELGWKTGTWYTLVSRCWPVEEHTFYGFWVRSGETGRWTHMVTMDVAAPDAWFNGGTDAFIEDWLETGENRRATNLRGGWKRGPDGAWHPFRSARYSVNSWDLAKGKRSFNFRTNWDGGVDRDDTGEFYYMIAGGADTKPTAANPSSHAIKRDEMRPDYRPIRTASAKARLRTDGMIEVRWENDPQTLPQFSFEVAVHDNPRAAGKAITQARGDEPHLRNALLVRPDGVPPEDIGLRLRCRDILDNESEETVFGIQAH